MPNFFDQFDMPAGAPASPEAVAGVPQAPSQSMFPRPPAEMIISGLPAVLGGTPTPGGIMEAISTGIQNVPAHWQQALGGGLQRFGAREQIAAEQAEALDRPITGISDALVKAKAVSDKTMGWIPGTPQFMGRMAGAGMDYFTPEARPAIEEAATGFGEALTERGAESLEAGQFQPSGELARYVNLAVEGGLGSMAPALAVGALTKSPAAAVATMGGYAGGQRFGEQLAAGRTAAEADVDALFSAGAEMAGGTLPLKYILGPMGKSVIGQAVKGTAAEGVEEMMTEALQVGYDQGVLDEDMSLGEAVSRIKDAGIVGSMAGGVVAGGAQMAKQAAAAGAAPAPEAPQPVAMHTMGPKMAGDTSMSDMLAALERGELETEEVELEAPAAPDRMPVEEAIATLTEGHGREGIRMEPEQWESFVADIKERGIQDPVELEEGLREGGGLTLTEGRHRVLAAQEAGLKDVPFRIKEADEFTADDVDDWFTTEPERAGTKEVSDDVVMMHSIGSNFIPQSAQAAVSSGIKAATQKLAGLAKPKKGAPGPLRRAGQILAASNDGVLRQRAKTFNSPAIGKVADMLYAEPGRKKAVGETYDEATKSRMNSNMNKTDKLIGKLSEKDLAQVEKLVVNPGAIKPGTGMHDAATGIRDLLKDELAYQRKAGVEIGEVTEGYFPRITDQGKIDKSPEAFKRDAAGEYMAQFGDVGLDYAEARAMADAWYDNLRLSSLGIDPKMEFRRTDTGMPLPRHTKGRTFKDLSPEFREKYMVTNPAEALPMYIMQSARRAEYERRFGGGKLNDMRKQIIKEGGEEALGDVDRAISSSLGQHGKPPKWATGIADWMKVYTTLRFLPRATLTSLSEFAMTGVRGGNALQMLRGTGIAMKEAMSDIAGRNPSEAREIAGEVLGLIGSSASESLLSQRFDSATESKATQKIQAGFFKATGLHQLTEGQRIGAMRVGQWFIERSAKSAADPDSAIQASSAQELAELGITDPEVFADTLPETIDRAWMESEEAAEYRTALRRFVDQTIMDPSASQRPAFATHPIGGLAYALTGFTYAFHKNVLQRTGRRFATAIKGEGLTTQDRLRMAGTAPWLLALAVIQAALTPLRDFMDDNKQKGWMDQLYTSISRAGLTGVYDRLFNIWTGAKYDVDPATGLAGPTISGVTSTFKAVHTAATTEADTNTALRNLAKEAWQGVVQPVANAILSKVGGVAGAVGIQAVSAKRTRSAFQDITAGEKRDKGEGRERRRGGRRSQERRERRKARREKRRERRGR